MKLHLAVSLALLTCAVAAASETGSSKSWHNGYTHGFKMASSGSMEMHYSSDNKPAHGTKPHNNYAYSMAYDKWDDDGKVKAVTHVARSGHMPNGADNHLHDDGAVIVADLHAGHVPYGPGSNSKSGSNVQFAAAHSAYSPSDYGTNLGLHNNNLGLNNVNNHMSHSSYNPDGMYNNHNNMVNSLGHYSLPGFNNLGLTSNHPGSNLGNTGYGHVGRMFPASQDNVNFVSHDTHATFNMGGADDWFGSKSVGHVMHAGYHPASFDALLGGNTFGNLGFDAFCDTFDGDSLFGSLF